MSTLWQNLYWHVRPLFWDNPLFKTTSEWYPPETDGPDEEVNQQQHYARFLRCWQFLRPFFASRGFTLYDHGPHPWATYPPTQLDPTSMGIDGYPYGRCFYEEREHGKFFLPSCLRIWAAQDKLGRDVVIKIVSEDELKVLRYLNTKEARSDPRNHTIPLIDSGTFSGLSFAITSRWDSAFRFHFKTVAELMHCTRTLLEGLDFLHENRVFHADILEQNIGMNAALYLPDKIKQPLNLRDPSTTRYAYYDFEVSKIYPLETPLDEIFETEYFGFELRGIRRPDGPFKVFPLDVLGLGLVLEKRTRHIVNIIPELGPFLDAMINSNEDERLTAQQSLLEFEKIYANLSTDQLSRRLTSWLWTEKRGICKINPDTI
ncbi:hypothetical protein BJ912DRAFT_1075526 [Pholiota molesta]|nr:hypothetical protein BJ912DRAFT_1075526 [Pholiota molesta]